MKKSFFFYNFVVSSVFICLFAFDVYAKEVILGVPFTSQAPEGRWTSPWDNTCEEASLLMVENYYRGNWELSVQKSKKDIEYVLLEKEKIFGKTKDESPDAIVQMIEKIYRRKARVEKDISLEKIKRQIDGGYPVIIAFDARYVSNSNFQSPKPTYHVAVIVGYDDGKERFVVNDPGTANGEHFLYGYKELLLANKKYTVRESGEVRGSDAVFTSSIRIDKQRGFLTKVVDFFRLVIK